MPGNILLVHISLFLEQRYDYWKMLSIFLSKHVYFAFTFRDIFIHLTYLWDFSNIRADMIKWSEIGKKAQNHFYWFANWKILPLMILSFALHRSHLPMLYVGLEHGLMNNVRLANSFFTQAHSLAPDDPFVLHELGTVAYQNDDFMKAEKYFLLVIFIRKYPFP